MNDIGYIDAIELQARTAAYLSTPGVLEDATGGGMVLQGDIAAGTDPRVWSRLSLHSVRQMVTSGETYYVSRDIVDTLFRAGQDLPGNWELRGDLIPTPSGFVVFPAASSTVADVDYLGFGWNVVPDIGVMLTVWAQDWPKAVHRMTFGRSLFWRFGITLEAARKTQEESLKPRGPREELDIAGAMLPLVATFLSFIEQRIVSPSRQALPRPTARRVAKHLEHEPVVRVVALRRRESTHQRSDEHVDRDYSCQWLVSGHWRQQWYPSLGKHQPKWIAPYVKGPEDKPLKVPRAKVFAVVR